MALANVGSHGLVSDVTEVRIHSDGRLLEKPFAQCNNKEIGTCGEELVTFFLEQHGMEIVERNWRCCFGEVDIIASDRGELALVEVKTRVAKDAGDNELAPEVAVGPRKRSRYEKLALAYLAGQTAADVVRFDVAAVKLVSEHDALVRYISGAYEWGN